MNLFLFLAAYLIFSPCDEFALAQRFTTKKPAVKAQAPKVKNSSRQKTADQNAERAYAALKAGSLGDARKFLGDANQSDPIAMYVRAALDQNAAEAADAYKEIVAENHSKPVGHEALLQLYKYHYAEGDYGSAHTDYVELRRNWNFPQAAKESRFGLTESSTNQLIDPAGMKDSLQTLSDFSDVQDQPEASAVQDSGKFVVQVGLFSTPENARKFVETLRAEKIDATIFTKIENEKKLYAVSAGSFPTREAAETFASDLKNRSINCMVVQK